MYINSSFRINNVVIEKVDNIKYLYFIIDRELKLKKHLYRKIGKNRGFFKRLRNKPSMLISTNIYNTMLKPNLEYGSTILYKYCTEQQLTILQKLWNKAMHSVLQLNRLNPITLMLDELRWLNVL